MINSNKLKARVIESGHQMSEVAEMMGISHVTLCNKMMNRTVFRPEEIKLFCEIVGITDGEDIKEIFLA